jgi:hypothetical protein
VMPRKTGKKTAKEMERMAPTLADERARLTMLFPSKGRRLYPALPFGAIAPDFPGSRNRILTDPA